MMARNCLHIRNILFFLLLFLAARSSKAQYDVYANELVSSSSDFYRPSNSVDDNPATYAKVSTLLGVAASSHLRVRFPEKGQSGDIVNITVQGTGSILGLDVLDYISVKLYDSGGAAPVATFSGASLLKLSLLVPGSNIYNLKVMTNPSAVYKFKEVRVEFSGLVSLSLLSEFRVYGFYFQRPCPPVYADRVTASGSTPLLADADNTSRAVDANPDNYASMNTIISVLGIGSAYMELGFPVMAKGGDYVGFTIAASTGLLDLDILGGLTLITYDQSGTVRQTFSGASLLNLKLLAGTGNRYSVGFVTQSGNYRIAKIRLVKTAVVGLLSAIRVYNGFHYAIDRPPVTVTTTGQTSFCIGDSVVLTAYDSLGGTNYVWNTGVTGTTVTVKSSGTYFVEVTDSMSCTRRSVPIGIVVNNKPVAHITGDSVLCAGSVAGLNLGSDHFAAQLWSTADTARNIAGLSTGKYHVTVTDTNACKGSDTIIVVQHKLNIIPAITPATCNDGTNGVVALSVSGGSGSYSYRWSNGQTTSSISGLKPGLYTCLVSDDIYGCSYNKSFTVTASNVLTTKMTIVNTSACTRADGQISLSVLGGSGSYGYLWSNGDTTASIAMLSAGMYTIRLTDKISGCIVRDTAVVGNVGNGLTVTPAVSNTTSCVSPNGSIALSVSGGSGTYAYQWSTGATSSSVSGLSAGTYYVIVKDVVSNCSQGLALTVKSNSSFTIGASVVAPGCQKNNGSITINAVTGGSGSYAYLWNTGSTSATLSGLPSGTYKVMVTDLGSGCVEDATYTLADSSMPLATLSITHPDCGSNGNGAVNISISGDHNVYAWSNGLNTKNISSLKPGIYTVTITDTMTNCMAVYKAELILRDQMKITASPVSNTSCATSPDGAVEVMVSGGQAPYAYIWSSGETVKDIHGKNAGTYLLAVTDANGCGVTVSVPLQTDSSRLLNASLAFVTKATCNTATNGSATTTVTGGKPPLSYLWTPGGATGKDLINVLAGTYTLLVTDAAGCTKQVIADIGIDSAVALKGVIDSAKASGCASSASGAVYVSISGGSTPYTYEWKRGATIVSSSKDLAGVIAGSYTLKVTDNNGCTLTLNALVPVLSSGITVTLDSVQRPTCAVSADGRVYTSVSGGLPPYTYSWSTGETSRNLTGANPGILVLTATDANGCPGQLIVELTFDTSGTLAVALDSSKSSGCLSGASGALYVTASGGTAPYTYSWSNGSTASDLTALLPNTYDLLVTDSKGCKALLSADVVVDTALAIKLDIDSVEGAGCVGSKSGKILLDVSRGVAPYTYTWSDGSTGKNLLDVTTGTYSVVVADAVGCLATISAGVGVDTAKKIVLSIDSVRNASCSAAVNGIIYLNTSGGKSPYTYSWSNGALTPNLHNVSAGLYNVTVIDANGCAADLSTSVGVDPDKAINVSALSVKDAGCTGSATGAINISVRGGIPPYTYNWSNGATTRDITGLSPGDYTLSLKDAAGCTAELNARINVDTANLMKLTATTVTQAKCAGSNSGAITVAVSGGVAPYSYLWSNGATTRDLSFIASGSYLLKVADAIGCIAELSVNVGIDNSNPPLLSLDSVRSAGCLDTLSGAIYVSASGGIVPYSYLWSNGATTQDIIGIPVGAYALELTDDAGCRAVLNVNVEKANPVKVVAGIEHVSCNGSADGSIRLSATGGSGNYTFLWSDGTVADIRSNLAPGDYVIKVSDMISGCSDSLVATITQADSLRLSAVLTKDTCLPGYDGAIELMVTGGVSPYSYSWSNGANSPVLQGLRPGTYAVKVTDAKGCSSGMEYVILEAECDYTLNIHDVITPNGDGKNDRWIIEGIQYYPDNLVQIVDKWGDLVYEKKNYDNSFEGVSSRTGNELPSGTYYYVIRLNAPNKTGGDNAFKGAILIQR